MKIESVKVNFAVADRISRKNILDMMSEMVLTPESNKLGFYGIEIEEDVKGAEEAPRQKRKYTRHVKPAENPGVKVTRRKMADGTTIENRGNCQGGGAV
jgi:hypothetical protein